MSIVANSHTESLRVSTKQLRRIVQQTLHTDSQLDAFCIDYFPNVFREFSDGMNRTQKENLLLVSAPRAELLERLGCPVQEINLCELSAKAPGAPDGLRVPGGRVQQWRFFNLRVWVALAVLLLVGLWLWKKGADLAGNAVTDPNTPGKGTTFPEPPSPAWLTGTVSPHRVAVRVVIDPKQPPSIADAESHSLNLLRNSASAPLRLMNTDARHMYENILDNEAMARSASSVDNHFSIMPSQPNDNQTTVFISLIGESKDADAIDLKFYLENQGIKTKRVPNAPTSESIEINLPPNLKGILQIEAVTVSNNLHGCRMGSTATQVLMDRAAIKPIEITIDLSRIKRTLCPLVVETSAIRVIENSQDLDCDGHCTIDLLPGTAVTLVVDNAPSRSMIVWEGDCTRTELSCDLQMTQSRLVKVKLDTEFRPKMIELARGVFQMGSRPEEIVFPDEVLHRVTLTTEFSISETEITQRQYKNVMKNLPGLNPTPSYFAGDPDRPVDSVSWLDAVTYCNELSKIEQIFPCYEITGNSVNLTEKKLKCFGYRLPTEAEWEYAARANTGTKYAGSESLSDVAWFFNNSGGRSYQVGSKKPNGWGLYDMSGNVWEWVWDWYVDRYENLPLIDPLGPEKGLTRVYRGGSLASNESISRLMNRRHENPESRYVTLGFRVVRANP